MMREKHVLRTILLLFVLLSALTAETITVNAASNTKLITKYLKYYKMGNFAVARSYANKLKATNRDTSLKKMSAKQKKAFRKTLTKYNWVPNYFSNKPYLEGYYLADLNRDRKPECLITYGSCEADERTIVYTYSKGKAKKVGSFYSGHMGFYAYPKKGVVLHWGHMGCGSVSVLYMKNGKLKTKSYGSEGPISYSAGYCGIPKVALDSHIRYDANYNRSVNLKDLK